MVGGGGGGGGGRYESHVLGSGLYVSGPREQPRERTASSATSAATPYTGGDISKSGELGRVFEQLVSSAAAAAPAPSRSRSGPLSRSGSGPLQNPKRASGTLSQIPPTGLITSTEPSPAPGPARRKARAAYGPAVTKLSKDVECAAAVPSVALWVGLVVLGLGIAVGVFLFVAVKKVEILFGVGGVVVVVGLLAVWNWFGGRSGVEKYLREFPTSSLDRWDLPLGKLVKITGVVTCGGIPLETSYQRVSRCVYTSTELYEYRGWKDKRANSHHIYFRWGLRHSEKHVADFYISDAQSGVRFLVRAGNGAKISSFIRPTTVGNITKENKEQSSNFFSWLVDHNLSGDDQIMRLEEGYLKEGNTASVMGVMKKLENIFFIDPPEEPVSIAHRWLRCLIPAYIEGIILLGERTPDGADYNV